MHLIKKIKSYFKKYEWHSWKDFDSSEYDIKFTKLDSEITLDIVKFIQQNLTESDEIGNKRRRLHQDKSIKCDSLDEVMSIVTRIIEADHIETSAESKLYNWQFQYVVGEHQSCSQTICISNVLTSKTGNCIYAIASIRKHHSGIYLWNHLG
ncbi:MAG: hypothetical protein IR153_04060 [Flavobacterium sp.]|nr:hypothetical protein [Flavobacterium sp.]